MKVATFTVRASEKQSVLWKRAADLEGFSSVGGWLADAADRYLDHLYRSRRPVPLAWNKGRFPVHLEDGERTVNGYVSPPFGVYNGTPAGVASYRGVHRYTLVYVPQARILATLRSFAYCRSLASELARLWVRWGGNEPSEDPAPLLQRFQREDL